VSDTRILLPKVEVAQRTDPGKDPEKQVNEDSSRYGETPFGHLGVLCDGMGGHEGGREASTLAVESIFRHVMNAATRADIPASVRAREVLRDAIAVANAEVFGLGSARVETRPGSTVVAVLVHPLGTEVAHVGDSRCYVVHRGLIQAATRDHSKVQQLVDAGLLSAEEAPAHPDSNMITRALGMSPTVDVEVQRASVVHEAGDTFILCSDGLTDLVTAPEILEKVAAGPPPQAARELVDLANARGGHDNITVVIVRTLEAALASPAEVPAPQEVSAPLALKKTEAMAATDLPSGARLPGVVEAPAGAASPWGGPPESNPLIPPAPSRPRGARPGKRPISPAIVLAVVIGLVCFAIVVVVVLVARGTKPSTARPAASQAHPSPGSPADGDAQAPDAGPRGRRRNHPRR